MCCFIKALIWQYNQCLVMWKTNCSWHTSALFMCTCALANEQIAHLVVSLQSLTLKVKCAWIARAVPFRQMPSPSCLALSPRGSSSALNAPRPHLFRSTQPCTKPHPTPPHPTHTLPNLDPSSGLWHFSTQSEHRSWLHLPSLAHCVCSPPPAPSDRWAWTP